MNPLKASGFTEAYMSIPDSPVLNRAYRYIRATGLVDQVHTALENPLISLFQYTLVERLREALY